jgi:hypothetical protein
MRARSQKTTKGESTTRKRNQKTTKGGTVKLQGNENTKKRDKPAYQIGGEPDMQTKTGQRSISSFRYFLFLFISLPFGNTMMPQHSQSARVIPKGRPVCFRAIDEYHTTIRNINISLPDQTKLR